MMHIRVFENQDWSAIWQIIQPVFSAGECYAFSPQITEQEAYKVWIELPTSTFVAINESDEILGTYYIKPNQPTLGAHVCNCGYIVSAQARGQGIASQMCQHSQYEAVAQGFRAMQFNLVVSTNKIAVSTWQKQGFEIVGTLPQAFQHSKLGLVDAFVMYKSLINQ